MRGRVRPSRLTILLLEVAWLGIFGPVAAAEEVSKAPNGPAAFDIPAQPLRDALYLFASQAGLQVSFNTSDIDRSLYSRPLKGSYTPEKGLKRLLKGTQLEFDFVDRGTVIVRERPQSVLARKAPSEPEQKPAPMEEVTVTGTSIRGLVPVGSPVATFTPEDFDRAGAATAQEFLETLPQNFGGGRSSDTTSRIPGLGNDNTYGGTAVNLRGLGSASTLVLINGHRQALSGAAEYVDISLVPLSAVERIEVFTDGASAVYGSDAVGGVVNFILMDDLDGFRTRLRTGTTTQGGGTDYQLAQAGGFKWASGNALLNYEFYKQESILDDQRDFTRDILGNSDFISGQRKNSLLLSAGQEVFENLQVSLDALYSERRSGQFNFVPQQGTESNEARNTQANVTGSVLWRPHPAWSIDLDLGSSANKIDAVGDDIINNSRSILQSRYSLQYADLKLNGSLFSLASGPMRLALGGSYRKEDYQRTQGNISSLIFRRIGDYKMRSVFAELMIPVFGEAVFDERTSRLAVSLAGRYEDYDTFGHRLNPKFGLEWIVRDGLKLRGSYGKSFRAPSVQQLDSVTGFYLLQNIATSNGSQRVLLKGGNASTLGPETSTSWTAGLDFKLDKSGSFTGKITWFDIDYRNRIANIPGSVLQSLTDPAFASVRVLRGDLADADFDALAARALSGQEYRVISGCPAMYRSGFACSEPAGNFSAIVDRGLRNLSATEDAGIDVTLERAFATARGVFNVGMSATYLFDYKRRITSLSPALELADTLFNPIDFRGVATLEWLYGAWALAATFNYADDYENTALDPAARISSWTTADFNVRYELGSFPRKLLQGAVLIFNVRNVFDADPPFISMSTQNGIYYDPANADPYGRQVSLALSKSW